MFVKLSPKQIEEKIKYMYSYMGAENAASGSVVDANANVTSKNICTLAGELHKDFNVQIKRGIVTSKLASLYGQEMADEYLRQLASHEIYAHDESSLSVYTYSPKEVVLVEYMGNTSLISFEGLFELCIEDAILEDEELDICCKYPVDMFVYDKDGKTRVTRLTKKLRHRDLVRVKTAFGEDIIVTDNHPMIVSDDKNDTVEAIDSLNKQQLRSRVAVQFAGQTEIDLSSLSPYKTQEFERYFISQEDKGCKVNHCRSVIPLSERLGYFIGFFIGDGNYHYEDGEALPKICITQKEKSTLENLANILYSETGIPSRIAYKAEKQNCWALETVSPDLVYFFKNVLGINPYSHEKTLPIHIFDYNREFALGLIAGLIDSDGTVKPDEKLVSIRLSSRSCIQQLGFLLKHLGFGVCNTWQSLPFGCNQSYKTNYSLWGVTFSKKADTPDLNSYKWAKIKEGIKTGSKYSDGWANIVKVQKLVQKFSHHEDRFLEEQCTYIYDITTESNTFVCNNLWVHNCAAISLYPFLLSGMEGLGGEAKAPKHLSSFCGNFVNLCFAISAQIAGAVGTPEFLMCFDYFARKDYGENYSEWFTNPVTDEEKQKAKDIENHLQSVVYALNQPAAARGFQSIFWNISIFDKNYFDAIFDSFMFPDCSPTNWPSLEKLQRFFMTWFNKERTKALLTFPVVTANLLTADDKPKDEELARFLAKEMSEGNSFFLFMNKNPHAISSCCRLAMEMTDTTFSSSLGAGGVATGSMNVITINVNRLVQDSLKDVPKDSAFDLKLAKISNDLHVQTEKIHKYQMAVKAYFDELVENKMLPIYDAGFVQMKKQFLTVGVNGILEGGEFLGLEPNDNEDYKKYVKVVVETIENLNRKHKTDKYMFNLEMVPAENLGVKFASWDKKDGYSVPRDCYNSYLYRVEDSEITIIDKMRLYEADISKFLSGGSAVHLNLEELADAESFYKLMCIAARFGVPYWTTNVMITCCENKECGYINKNTESHCVKCGSKNVSHATRIIGYLKKINSWAKPRVVESQKRFYVKADKEDLG